jgi:hypothetical protein
MRFALQNVACPGGYDLDQTHNFTTVGPNGENSGPQSVPVSVIDALNASEFTDAQQVTLASLLSDAVTGGIDNNNGGTAFAILSATPGISVGGGGGGTTNINNGNGNGNNCPPPGGGNLAPCADVSPSREPFCFSSTVPPVAYCKVRP